MSQTKNNQIPQVLAASISKIETFFQVQMFGRRTKGSALFAGFRSQRKKETSKEKRKKEGNLVTALGAKEKGSPGASHGRRSERLTLKGGATDKQQGDPHSLLPTLTLIVPSILGNFHRTRTISQT